MLEKLFLLLGKSIESDEVKMLFEEWSVTYPTKFTCTPNNATVKTKMRKDGIKLYFTMGGNSKYLKPIPAKSANSYIGIFSMIEIDKKCTLALPFDISHALKPVALTEILGEPKETVFMGKSTIWRKNINEKLEIIVNHNEYTDGSKIESITIAFNYEAELNTEADYKKVGL
jgi:hypothetical protein